MIAAKRGNIICLASMAGKVGSATSLAYCASKAAVISITRSLALAGAPYGIRANCVCPGFINSTEMWKQVEAGASRALGQTVEQANAERLAEFCATYPDRITAFASVTLQFPELAAEQLENAVKKLGLRGAAVGASCAGVDFSDPKFAPFWRTCEDLDVVVFIHPQSTPELHQRLAGNGWLANTIGNPLDTTICLEKLIFEGTLDKHPKLTLLSAHGGGFVPSYAPRMDHACRVAPDECDPSIQLKKKPTEYLRDMYYDTLVFTGEALRHLAAEVGSDKLVIGTDHPIPWHPDPVTHIMDAPGFSDEERIAMLGGTAAKLLKL
jgi:aminocarboxymuconate-semialdehyde decarboxylase